MTTEEALAEVHRHFCSADGTAHDDACVALQRWKQERPTDFVRELASDREMQREANLSVGWDDGPEQGAWLRALADAVSVAKGTHHLRGVAGCHLPVESVGESPNCWCPRYFHAER